MLSSLYKFWQKMHFKFINWQFFLLPRASFSTNFNLQKKNYIGRFGVKINFKKINFFFLFSPTYWNLIKISFPKVRVTSFETFEYVRNLMIFFLIDSILIDDEPIWEPLEWSLIQTWIFFIFIFAWIGEVLIGARYGSYTGRDKRVWLAWYKVFWGLELWYLISFCLAALFVIVPFFHEITYQMALIVSWWDWYSRIFFFQVISLWTLLLLIGNWVVIRLTWLNWKKIFLILLSIEFVLSYIFFWQFFISFFAYFTDPIWYQKTCFNNYIQLSHEPLKWGWGDAKRDHFTYHRVSTVFWFKNDSPFASAFLMFNLFFLLSLFFINLFWLTTLRRILVLKEIPVTLVVYTVSSLKHTLFFLLLIYGLVFISFITNYWRFPIEFLWILCK